MRPLLAWPVVSSWIASLAVAVSLLASGTWTASAKAEEPLHEKIDRAIAAAATGPLSDPASDATFLRRAYLDLAGRIPASEEAQKFLALEQPDKRARLIDWLLSGPDYPRRMKDFFHVMLMERRGTDREWDRFLLHSFASNRPWDAIVRDLVKPDDENEHTRGSAYFFTRRLDKYGQNPVDMPRLVRDVGRLFMGVDVQCAQCHNHPFIDDYRQVHYQGLYAYVGHIMQRRGTEFPALDEKLVTSKVEFVSVFTAESGATGPQLPWGEEVAIPMFEKDQQYRIPPDRKKRLAGVPRFSPLAELAQRLPSRENRWFRHNIANRLWWMLMGRGLVHPLDMHHEGNPASHPEVLALLADELAAHDFDLKYLLREIALSKAYARSTRLPAGLEEQEVPESSYRTALEKPLSAEQLLFSVLVATGEYQQRYGAIASPLDRQKQGAAGLPPEPPLSASELAEPDGLLELRDAFKEAFANPATEPEVDFSPSVRAALFMLNGPVVLEWLKRKEGNLVDRLCRLDEKDQRDQLVDELYLSVLTRLPGSEERRAIADWLAAADQAEQREKAITQLVWALLASTEANVNH